MELQLLYLLGEFPIVVQPTDSYRWYVRYHTTVLLFFRVLIGIYIGTYAHHHMHTDIHNIYVTTYVYLYNIPYIHTYMYHMIHMYVIHIWVCAVAWLRHHRMDVRCSLVDDGNIRFPYTHT